MGRVDSERFERHVMPHLDAGYNLARWLTRDTHDAEDVLQDACVRAMSYAHSLRESSARAWFLTVVRHACYDWLARNRPAETSGDGAAVLASMADPAAPDPLQVAIRHAETRVLADALEALPLAYREVLVLREFDELSYKEIARVVDVPVGTVMSRLSRARSLLQRSPLLRAIDASGGGR
jgi:RNA polymerase sigma-70 factor (ECF subfamily)